MGACSHLQLRIVSTTAYLAAIRKASIKEWMTETSTPQRSILFSLRVPRTDYSFTPPKSPLVRAAPSTAERPRREIWSILEKSLGSSRPRSHDGSRIVALRAFFGRWVFCSQTSASQLGCFCHGTLSYHIICSSLADSSHTDRSMECGCFMYMIEEGRWTCQYISSMTS